MKKNIIKLTETDLPNLIAEEVKKIVSTTNTQQEPVDNHLSIQQSSEQEHNNAINLMKGFMDNGKPKVGIFWYNYIDNICDNCNEEKVLFDVTASEFIGIESASDFTRIINANLFFLPNYRANE